ncbi:hypothetical protein ACFLZI_02310, partial [Nitrospirota bacterium]
MRNSIVSTLLLIALIIIIPIHVQAGDIEFSGAIETELTSETTKAGSSTTNTDITTATVELGVDAAVNDKVSGTVVFKWEEGGTDYLDVDEAFITINPSETM